MTLRRDDPKQDDPAKSAAIGGTVATAPKSEAGVGAADLVGTAQGSFQIAHNRCILTYTRGQVIRADALLKAAIDKAGAPVEWGTDKVR